MAAHKLPRQLLLSAALSAAITVALGAYGAHGLDVSDTLLRMWETAVSYQMWHALGALVAGGFTMFLAGASRRIAFLSGWLLLIGSWGFSFSLYYFVKEGIIPVPGLAPIGGMTMILGWILLGVAFLIRTRNTDSS